MTDTPDSEERLRRGARRLAETFADREAPTVVAMLADAAEPGASWRGAAELADAASEHRRTLLVNLAGSGSGLDRFLQVDGREGLEAVRAGDRTLSEAAVHPPGRGFLYLPSGEAGGDRPRPTEDEGFVRALGRLAERVREARGLLLLYLEAGALPRALAEDLVDGTFLLAGADPHLPDGIPVLGRTGPDEPSGDAEAPGADAPRERPAGDAADASSLPEEARGEEAGREAPEGGDASGPGESDETDRAEADGPAEGEGEGEGPDVPPPWVEPGEDEDDDGEGTGRGAGADRGDWRRHRRRSGPPWGKIAAAAAVILLLAGGWWWLAARSRPADGTGAQRAGTAVADAGAAEIAVDSAPGREAAPDRDPAAGRDPAGRQDPATGGGDGEGETDGEPADATREPAGDESRPEDVVASAPELSHSVLVASYSSWPVARARAERLREEAGGTWVVAPTTVRGSLYWRLYGGAAPDRAAGRRLMERLVERGVKDRARDWDVRPASLTYRIETVRERPVAEERAAALRDRGLPAYVLPAAADGDTVWQICAGAYESRRAAGRLGDMLLAEGLGAELVTRRGEGDDR